MAGALDITSSPRSPIDVGCLDHTSPARTSRAVRNSETRMITRTDLSWWLDLEQELDWQFATTYADGAPHEYVASPRTEGLDVADYARAAHVIQTFGEPMKFYKSTRIYLRTPMGWKHWTMDADLDETKLVNRGRVEHVYGIQNMPVTRSDAESSYDAFASIWDKKFALTEAERSQAIQFIRDVFGDKLWRTLDVGCGTGWPVTVGLVDPVRYVGIDPSTAMLNALVAKHPILACVHPMSWATATRQRVLCGTRFDTVLSLGGSASYLTPEEVIELAARGKRGAIVMHYTEDEMPITDDLDPVSAAASLAAATEIAEKQLRVGRFMTTHLPPQPCVI